MRILILGGTRFLGRHLVAAALDGGHEVTLFNRGTHPATALPNVETIHGDRNHDLFKLQERSWDAVVDTCGYLPRAVRASAEALSDSVERYVFISSISAYADVSVAGLDETAPLAKLTDDQMQQANAIDSSGQVSAVTFGRMYGGLKALCEQAAEEVMPNRVLIIRPGLIVGPYDYSDRFTYWVVRIAGGGEVLVPGRPGRCLQLIDVRDLAEWIVRLIEQKETGAYHATGLPGIVTMQSVVEECKAVSHSEASLTWVSDDFLLEEKVVPWGEMSLWMPETAPHVQGFMFMNCAKAIAAGLNFRPLRETIADTLTWWQHNCVNETMKAGITRDKEESLLRKWHARVGA
jgi:2'-hydroxyisoflavone reductase